MAKCPRIRDKCTTGCPIVDASLGGGGLTAGIVTELVGESGAAKTQLALQVLVTTQLPREQGGLAGNAFYIPTEGYVPFRRLRQIADAFARSRGLQFDPCCNVLVEPADSIQGLFALLDRIDSLVRSSQMNNLRTLVIDSVASLFRSEFENNREEMVVRSGLLFQLAGKLRSLADRYEMVTVVTNQVTDWIGDTTSVLQVGNLCELRTSGRLVTPALGLAWSHCVNFRIFLSRRTEYFPQMKRQRLENGSSSSSCVEVEEVRSCTMRTLHVVFAPHVPYASCDFVVDTKGVRGLG